MKMASNKKIKFGTAIKKVTQAIGIEPCENCEQREFQINRLNHKKPIIKVDEKDKEDWNSSEVNENVSEIYLKYFGLDNTASTNEKIKAKMIEDLNKLFE